MCIKEKINMKKEIQQMKELFNRRQRFSLRKYSIGVCSVLLGTALFAVGAPSVAADEAVSTSQPREVVAVSSP